MSSKCNPKHKRVMDFAEKCDELDHDFRDALRVTARDADRLRKVKAERDEARNDAEYWKEHYRDMVEFSGGCVGDFERISRIVEETDEGDEAAALQAIVGVMNREATNE